MGRPYHRHVWSFMSDFRGHSISVAPNSCNELLESLWNIETVDAFKNGLQTFLINLYSQRVTNIFTPRCYASMGYLAESNGCLPPGLWLTPPAGWLPRTGISSGTPRSVIEYGLPLPFLLFILYFLITWPLTWIFRMSTAHNHSCDCKSWSYVIVNGYGYG